MLAWDADPRRKPLSLMRIWDGDQVRLLGANKLSRMPARFHAAEHQVKVLLQARINYPGCSYRLPFRAPAVGTAVLRCQRFPRYPTDREHKTISRPRTVLR
jgi:hypothetical protein